MSPERLILLLLEFHTVFTSLPAIGEVFNSPIADRRVNYHIAKRDIYAGDIDHGTPALDFEDYPADLQHVKQIKKNTGWKVTGAVLKSRHKPSRKCLQYSYPESVKMRGIPLVKQVPCGDESSHDAKTGIGGSKQSPIEGKSSEEGLSVYNEDQSTLTDEIPSKKRSRHPRSTAKVSEYPSSEFSKEMYRRVFEWIDGSDGSTPSNDTNSEEVLKILTKDDVKATDVKVD